MSDEWETLRSQEPSVMKPSDGVFWEVFFKFFEFAMGVSDQSVVILKITFGRSFSTRNGIQLLRDGVS
jgi:hypothetical protein